jgi:hypothetical protein
VANVRYPTSTGSDDAAAGPDAAVAGGLAVVME